MYYKHSQNSYGNKADFFAQIKQFVGGIDSETIQIETPCSVKQLVNKIVRQKKPLNLKLLIGENGLLKTNLSTFLALPTCSLDQILLKLLLMLVICKVDGGDLLLLVFV